MLKTNFNLLNKITDKISSVNKNIQKIFPYNKEKIENNIYTKYEKILIEFTYCQYYSILNFMINPINEINNFLDLISKSNNNEEIVNYYYEIINIKLANNQIFKKAITLSVNDFSNVINDYTEEIFALYIPESKYKDNIKITKEQKDYLINNALLIVSEVSPYYFKIENIQTELNKLFPTFKKVSMESFLKSFLKGFAESFVNGLRIKLGDFKGIGGLYNNYKKIEMEEEEIKKFFDLLDNYYILFNKINDLVCEKLFYELQNEFEFVLKNYLRTFKNIFYEFDKYEGDLYSFNERIENLFTELELDNECDTN